MSSAIAQKAEYNARRNVRKDVDGRRFKVRHEGVDVMKVTVAIDSFKGSMTSVEAGNAAKSGILRVFPDAEVVVYPVADGGEGTVAALQSCYERFERRSLSVTGPLGNKVEADYMIIARENRRLAVMEMASAAGLALVPAGKRNPLYTTTYGVGEMIRDAIGQGCREFILGLGGSATSDGGVGMLQALGYDFVKYDGNPVSYGAKGLGELADIGFGHVMPELADCTFYAACDVENPLLGEQGCCMVFAPQKGADEKMLADMERSMTRYANLVEHLAECDMSEIHRSAGYNRDCAGAGAAGGMGYACMMFLHARLERGIHIILREIGIERDIIGSDYVITGEGRIDTQTAMGKTTAGIAEVAHRYKKPVLTFAGEIGSGARTLIEDGISDAYFCIQQGVTDLETAMCPKTAGENMADTVEQVFRVLHIQISNL